LSEFLRSHYGSELPSTTTREYLERWLSSKRVEISLGTHDRYSDAVRKFLAFLGAQAERSIEEITSQQITAFRDHQVICSAAGTVNTDLKTIRRIFQAARLDGYLFQNPAEGVKSARDRGTLKRRPFTIDEIRAVLEIASPEWQSLIKFGIYTGQRLADLALLTWAQIDLEREEIRLTTRKTGKPILIPMAGPLKEHLLTLPAGDSPKSPVHPKAFEILRAQNGRVGTLSNQFAELLANTGLRKHRDRNHRSPRNRT
jgi:integrase